jgi:hypothetical protein
MYTYPGSSVESYDSPTPAIMNQLWLRHALDMKRHPENPRLTNPGVAAVSLENKEFTITVKKSLRCGYTRSQQLVPKNTIISN